MFNLHQIFHDEYQSITISHSLMSTMTSSRAGFRRGMLMFNSVQVSVAPLWLGILVSTRVRLSNLNHMLSKDEKSFTHLLKLILFVGISHQ